VIDFARCTQCLQCLSFCLFDVYGVDGEKRISVERPDNCKPDCPACSRVCPEAAIMFPKYGAAPIDGSEVTAENVGREAVKVDISKLLGGDVYKTLRKRGRFSREQDPQRALEERRRQLALLGMTVELPGEKGKGAQGEGG
jgi:NAD-dependent dihydropyrimidine dehydrogenase PreA subunit